MNGLNKVGYLVHYLITQLPYHRLSYNVYMDNYFSNVPLFQNLRQIGIGACGTVRAPLRLGPLGAHYRSPGNSPRTRPRQRSGSFRTELEL